MPGAHSIFDPATFLPELDARLKSAPDARTVRAETVATLQAARSAAMDDIIAGFSSHPRAARETVRAIASLTDAIVTTVHHVATTHLHPTARRPRRNSWLSWPLAAMAAPKWHLNPMSICCF